MKHWKLISIVLTTLSINTFASKATYTTALCKHPELYRCITVKRRQTWQKLFPNKEKRNLIKRLNRMNIPLRRGMRIAIPKDPNRLDYFALAPFPLVITPPKEEMIIFDPRKLAWAAYNQQGELAHWGPASGGSSWCPDIRRACRTARGKFVTYSKGNAYCKSGKYPRPNGGAPMPYCMHFYRGFALHASTTVPGFNASHGCIRLFKTDAKWLNQQFIDIEKRKGRTQVIVLPYGPIDITNGDNRASASHGNKR